MRGLHLTADLYQCRCESRWLVDPRTLGHWVRQVAEAQGLQVLHDAAQTTAEDGSTTVALLLAHSHVCLHTWPGQRGATVDVHLAGSTAEASAQARSLMDALVNRFAPEWTEQRSMDRGTEGE